MPVSGLPLIHAGKVRRLYALPDPATMLMVATDAISAFDHVLQPDVPGKGVLLNQMSLWWFEHLDVPNHVVSTEVPDEVRGRAVVVERLEMIPVECVARGYLTGSGWQEYQRSQTVCGVALPAGLVDGDRLPEPIFTPATKAPLGEHDENVTFERMCATTGDELGTQLRELTLGLYRHAAVRADEVGLILADTKFEFGRRTDGTIVLADEVLTPDSSRFWDAATWRPGQSMEDFSKQYLRNWLLHESGWDKSSDAPPPELPAEIVEITYGRYAEAYERITGRSSR